MVVFAVAFDGSLLAGGFCWSWRDALLDDLMLFLKVVPRRARRLLRHEHMCITLRLRLAILDPTVVAMLAEPMLKTSVVDKTISMRPYPRELNFTICWSTVAADAHPIDVSVLRYPLWQAWVRFCRQRPCRWRHRNCFQFQSRSSCMMRCHDMEW